MHSHTRQQPIKRHQNVPPNIAAFAARPTFPTPVNIGCMSNYLATGSKTAFSGVDPLEISFQEIPSNVSETERHSSVEHAMSDNWKINTFSGLVAGFVNDIALYASDSKKIILQNRAMGVQSCVDSLSPLPKVTILPNSPIAAAIDRSSSFVHTTKPLFRGLIPVILSGTGPSLGIFFLVYSSTKKAFSDAMTSNEFFSSESVIVREMVAASVASTFAAIPTSVSTIPSDVIKKAAIGSSSSSAFRSSLIANYRSRGISSFFVGWQASLAKDIPLAFIKMPLYVGTCEVLLSLSTQPWYPHALLRARPERNLAGETNSQTFSPVEVGIVGAVSGALTAFLTMPMDAVNTRMKAPSASYAVQNSYSEAAKQVLKSGGLPGFFAGSIPRVVNFSLGSAIFWLVFDAIQKVAVTAPITKRLFND